MSVIDEFRKFALRGSVVDLAVGFTVGAAFTTIVKSLVQDVILPPIGLVLGSANFDNLYFVLRATVEKPGPYATLAEAQAAGAVTLNYGVFLNNLVALLIIAVVMFMVVRGINHVHQRLEQEFGEEKPKSGDPSEKKCAHCLSTIAFKATRCPFCTSQLEPPAPRA